MSESDRIQTARPSLLTRLIVWTWLGYWVLLFAVMHVPKPPGAQLVQRLGDKVLHTAAYFVLATLGGWAARRRRRRLDAGWMVRWGLIYAAYAAADEILQPLINRTCQLTDWLADVIGVALALSLAWWLESLRARRK